MSAVSINATQKTYTVLNNNIRRNNIHNNNKEFNIVNDNDIETNSKTIENRGCEHESRKRGVDTVSPRTSKYIIILRPKEVDYDIRSTMRVNLYNSNDNYLLIKIMDWLFKGLYKKI